MVFLFQTFFFILSNISNIYFCYRDHPEIKYLYSNLTITFILLLIALKLFNYADKRFDDFA